MLKVGLFKTSPAILVGETRNPRQHQERVKENQEENELFKKQ